MQLAAQALETLRRKDQGFLKNPFAYQPLPLKTSVFLFNSNFKYSKGVYKTKKKETQKVSFYFIIQSDVIIK